MGAGRDGDGDREGSGSLLQAHPVPTAVGVRTGVAVPSSRRAPGMRWARAHVRARPGAGGTACPCRSGSGVTSLNNFPPPESRERRRDTDRESGETQVRWQRRHTAESPAEQPALAPQGAALLLPHPCWHGASWDTQPGPFIFLLLQAAPLNSGSASVREQSSPPSCPNASSAPQSSCSAGLGGETTGIVYIGPTQKHHLVLPFV